MVLQDGITVKSKSLREQFEVYNHDKALKLLYELTNKEIKNDTKDILSIHGLIQRSIEDKFAGRYRTGNIRITGANIVPPNHSKVDDLMDDLIKFTNENPQNLDVITLSTLFNHRLAVIHPFFDNNGRTVRLAMNQLLLK